MTGGYAAYSIVSQTVVQVIAFTLWWRWMDRRERNVTRGLI